MGSVAGLLAGLSAGKVLAFIVYQATPWTLIVLGRVVLTMLRLGLVAGGSRRRARWRMIC